MTLWRMYRHSALVIIVLIALDAVPTALGQDQQARTSELEEARKLHQQIEKLIDDEKFTDALPLAQRALAIREKWLPADHAEIADSLSDLGIIYTETREFTSARPLLQRALTIREKSLGRDDIGLIDSLIDLTNLHRASNDLASLEPVLQRILAIREKNLPAQHPDIAAALNALALFYLNRSDYERAEPLFRRALEIREKAFGPEHALIVQSLNNLAELYRRAGDYKRAEPLFKRALAMCEKMPGARPLDLALSLNYLAGLYQTRGDYEAAEPLFRRALEIREKAQPESLAVADLLNNLALLYKQKADFDRAEPLYKRALAIREKRLSPDAAAVAESLNNLGVLYLEKGDYASAAPLLNRAVKIREKVFGANHRAYAESVSNLGTLAFYEGDYARSEALHSQVLTIFEDGLGPDHPLSCLSRNNLAQIYTTNGKLTQAAALLARNNESREKNLVSILSIGSERARLSYMATLAEEADFTVTFNTRFAPRSPLATRTALTRVLRTKGRVVDAMADSIGTLLRRANPEDRRLIERLAAVRSELAALILRGGGNAAEYKANVERLEAEARQIEERVSERSAELRVQAQKVTLADVQRALPAGATLLEFVLYHPFNNKPKSRREVYGRGRYMVYVIGRRGEPKAVELGDAAEIDAAVNALRQALRGPGRRRGVEVDDGSASKFRRGDVTALARRLDARVMQPVRRLLGTTRHIFISPDGALNLVPFAALTDESGRPMVMRYLLTYLTSGRDLLRLQEKLPSRQKTMVFANPDFGIRLAAAKEPGEHGAATISDIYFDALPGAEMEAEMLKGLFPDATVLKGKEATEGALKKVTGPGILHIATHGFFLEDVDNGSAGEGMSDARKDEHAAAERQIENPLSRSGLALAGANQRRSGDDDGMLTALEATGLDLWGTQLVVLSACETGLGEIRNGEGVYGLRRALLLAGSESQIISLWQVSDDDTRALMSEYYKRLQAGEGRGAALQHAQLAMLRNKKTAHPYFWAPFIQSGEWRSLQNQPPSRK